MKLYIELIVVSILMMIIILWKMWQSYSRWRLLKKYKPENDRTKKGGIDNGATTGAKSTTDSSAIGNVGPNQSKGQELLPKTNASDDGKNSNSSGKDTSVARRRFLRRYSRK